MKLSAISTVQKSIILIIKQQLLTSLHLQIILIRLYVISIVKKLPIRLILHQDHLQNIQPARIIGTAALVNTNVMSQMIQLMFHQDQQDHLQNTQLL